MLSLIRRRAISCANNFITPRSEYSALSRNLFKSHQNLRNSQFQNQISSSFWSKKEENSGDNDDKNKHRTTDNQILPPKKVDEVTEKSSEGILQSIWKAMEDQKTENRKYDDDALPGLVFIIFLVAMVYFVLDGESVPQEKLVPEKECEAKVLADLAPGTHPGSNHIKRVKMTHRLPIESLVKNGVEHAALEGTLWTCGGKPDIAHGDKVHQQQYWSDEAAYELTPEAAGKLRVATEELHAMCLDVVDAVVESDDLLTLFEIPKNMWDEVRRSWRQRDRDFIGRFDFMWDGRGEPKLAEYNADTPTILVETAVGQRMWSDMMNLHHPNGLGWTFNALDEQIQAALSGFLAIAMRSSFHPPGEKETLHLTGVFDSVEEREHLRYLGKIALLAGFSVQYVSIAHVEMMLGKLVAVHLQPGSSSFSLVDGVGYEPIKNIFKLYPYEWLAHENLGETVFRSINTADEQNRARWIEPAWKLVLGNKAILAVLWEKFPGHPNLLPAYFELPDDIHSVESGYNSDAATSTVGINYVAKPKFGREGQGIVYGHKYTYASDFITAAEQQIYSGKTSTTSSTSTPRSYGDDVYLGYPVYQQYFETATFSMRHIVIGSWVVGGIPSGFNFREDSTATTQDSSCFVPHYITGPSQQKGFAKVYGKTFTPRQKQLYKELYGIDIADTASKIKSDSSDSSAAHIYRGGYTGGSSFGSGRSPDLSVFKDLHEAKKEKEEKERKAREERDSKEKQGKDANNKKDDNADKNANRKRDTSNRATAERFRQRAQAGGHHHHSARSTGSSYRASKSSASRGGFGRGG